MVSEVKEVVFYEGAIILRKEALEKGLKRYFTGKACKRGHISERVVGNGNCCECGKLKTARWRKEGGCSVERKVHKGKQLPSLDQLNNTFIYEESSGKLYWKDRPPTQEEDERTYNTWKSRWRGKEAGAKHYANGYIEVRVNKKLYKAHRLIWKMVTGQEPTKFLDHINGITSDNRFCNLREATPQENARNAKTWSGTQYKGVTYDKSKGDYIANFCIDDVTTTSRGFKTAKEAAVWYDEQVREVYGEFAKLNFKEGE